MHFRTSLLATTLLVVPGLASAQSLLPTVGGPGSGLYIAGAAGVNWLEDSDLNTQGALRTALGNAGVGQTGTASFDMGWVGMVSLGYAFGNGLRTEIEGSYRSNGIDGVGGFNGIAAPRTQGGDVETWAAMFNVFYDFDLGMALGPVGFVPYIGGGIGYGWQSWDSVQISAPSTGRSVTIDGDNNNFAWQVMVGAAFPIADVPGLAITAEGRYFASLSDDVGATYVSGPGAAPQRGSVEVDNGNWSILLGVRYTFGVAPPPPPVAAPVAAAPAPARTYLVFFDWDRADLNDRARQIIEEAAMNSTRVQTTRIEIAGHADRSGTPQYNQRLSERRAQAVAAELERRGVPRSAMVIQAFGESRPLVPTADGVREPQNRRVEIVLR
jgi:outer membrane protein OmpA-like peptidoglycan-associated protein